MENSYVLEPLSAGVTERLRQLGGERYIADAKPGYPCRRCLRDAEVGDVLILVAHDPFDGDVDSPYRSSSPIFVHEQPCEPPADLGRLPEQLVVRKLSVRAFDEHAMMIDAAVVDGTALDVTLQRFFERHDADHVHVHNASRGCWATTVRRAD